MRTLLLLLLASSGLLAQTTVESVPNQKVITGSYVSNPDKILDQQTVAEIDTALALLEKKTTVQVAVVALASIGDADIVEFGQKLFTLWGIGRKENDNGLLLLLVRDQRTIRFHTGYGVEGVLPDFVCKRIQMKYMVPEFKNGNYGAGILAGIRQIELIITNPQHAEELKAEEKKDVSDWTGFVFILCIVFAPIVITAFIVKATKGQFADSKDASETSHPEMRLTRLGWLAEFIVIPVLIIVAFATSSIENATGFCFLTLYAYFMLTLLHRLWRGQKVIKRFLKQEDHYEIVEFIRRQQWYWFLMGLLFPFPFFLYFFYHLSRKHTYRNYPRKCKQCQNPLHKLGDLAEDDYLSKGQLLEESLRSVDYDVWKCDACQNIEMWFYLNRSSRYEPCPRCKTIAFHLESDRTLESATYSSSGKGEKLYSCKFCNHKKKSTYTIARLVQHTTSGSSSFGGSSSGGSWGGGRSGGGGASSSW